MALSKKDFATALAQARNAEYSKKRNFTQSVDLVIPLKGLNLKKPEHQVDLFVDLPGGSGKKSSICALVGPELEPEAKSNCDALVSQTDFAKYAKDKKLLKKLARLHDFFVGQANIMPQIATTFGRVLGPKGKMPNPKAGCVVPQKASLKQLAERLQKLVRVSAKTAPLIQCRVGVESMSDDELAANAATVYEHLLHALPQGEQNIKSVFVKLTMGKSVPVSAAKTAENEA